MTTQEASSQNAEKSEFVEQGYLILRNFMSPTEVDEIREAFMAANADGPVAGVSDISAALPPADPLAFYPRMMNPHSRPDMEIGRLAARLIIDSRFLPVLTDLLGEEPVAVQSMFYFKPPGARGQELHQDNFYLRVKPGTCVAAWIAVDDVDSANGGMRVVPGSQNLEIACPEQADLSTSFTSDYVPPPPGMEAVPVDLKAGDVLFFNGSLIHGSTPNTSEDRFRRSLIFHYAPLRSQELSQWYSSITFAGEAIKIPSATGGGPCGTTVPSGRH